MTVPSRASLPVGAAADAVASAKVATEAVHAARAAMILHAEERRDACLAAHRAGVSIRRLADELGLSPGAVQRVVETARARRPAAGFSVNP